MVKVKYVNSVKIKVERLLMNGVSNVFLPILPSNGNVMIYNVCKMFLLVLGVLWCTYMFRP